MCMGIIPTIGPFLLPRLHNGHDNFAATSLHTLIPMVTNGLGITLLPRLALAAGIGEGIGLAIRRLSDAPAERVLGLAWRPNSPRSPDVRALASHLTETCRAMLMDKNR